MVRESPIARIVFVLPDSVIIGIELLESPQERRRKTGISIKSIFFIIESIIRYCLQGNEMDCRFGRIFYQFLIRFLYGIQGVWTSAYFTSDDAQYGIRDSQ
jgi:hypothetical protein